MDAVVVDYILPYEWTHPVGIVTGMEQFLGIMTLALLFVVVYGYYLFRKLKDERELLAATPVFKKPEYREPGVLRYLLNFHDIDIWT